MNLKNGKTIDSERKDDSDRFEESEQSSYSDLKESFPNLIRVQKENCLEPEVLKSFDISASSLNSSNTKMSSQEKSREQVKIEREAKKAAKAAAKLKGKVEKTEVPKPLDEVGNSKEPESQEEAKPIKVNNAEAKPAEIPETKQKSKADLRAERREKQEAQRVAKQDSLHDKKVKTKPAKVEVSKPQPKAVEPVKKAAKPETKENLHEVNLFKHLYSKQKLISELVSSTKVKIHPAIARLGVKYADKVIVGSNARCVALLAAVKQLIIDFERPLQADFTRGLEASLQESVSYLSHCRPAAVSMQNALKHLKRQMSTLPAAISDEDVSVVHYT